MAVQDPPPESDPPGDEHASVHDALVHARNTFYEFPGEALSQAIGCYEMARRAGQHGLCARARAVQAAVSAHRGDLSGALELLVDAERHWQSDPDPTAGSEISALKAQLSFFTGGYSEALRHAETAIALADAVDDLRLRIHVRRTTCMVYGNVGVPDLGDRIQTLLDLSIQAGEPWEEAISRNDLAHYLQENGDLPAARREIELGLEQALQMESQSRFAQAVLHCTHADILLGCDQPADALVEARRAAELLAAQPEPNPYVVGATVRAEVQARMALGELEDAQRSGEGALTWLGDRVPQTRSLILGTLATALRDAGKLEEAYEALERAAGLERQAFRELSGLHLKLERATLEASAARRESDELVVLNRRLARAHGELKQRTAQLEGVQDKLRDQADRDWLTGLYNRRYLARELERLTQEGLSGPLSLAVLDLDHFKSINDRFGHAAGDQVLVRVARLLTGALRGSDVVVRTGGEEFVLLMPFTALGPAVACCERICELIRRERWDVVEEDFPMTASVGVASGLTWEDVEGLVTTADRRLYEAKHAGRDCVVGGELIRLGRGRPN